MNDKIYYFDNAASTYMFDEVIEYINHINRNFYANASSTHFAGIASHDIVKTDKEALCDILHINPNTLVFTSGGTESNNLAIKGTAFVNFSRKGNIVITAYEHASVINSAKYLEKFGFEIRICPLKSDGTSDIDGLYRLIDDKTILVSTAHVSSELGTISDIEKISSIVKAVNPDCLYHVDAVQSFGKIRINLAKLNGVDMMSFSSHKIHGPKGVGALYVKNNVNIDPLLNGSVQSGLRAGTQNISGICGFSRAAGIIHNRIDNNHKHVSSLKRYFIENLALTGLETRINTPGCSSPYILNIAFKDIKSEVLLNALSERGICVSSGSACSSKSAKISEVLKAMSLPIDYIEGAIRLSFCEKNTKEDIDYLLKTLEELVPVLSKFIRK